MSYGTAATPNTAPAGSDKTLTFAEDGSIALSAGDFGFTDSDGNTLQSVTLTSLPTAGTLTLNGGAVAAGQVVVAADLGGLVFTPAANANGVGYAKLTFQVTDSGGTANGGQNTDQSPNTLTFNVTAVNDAPSATNLSTAETYTEDTPLNLTDIVASDVDSANLTVTLTLSNVAAGALSTGTSGAVTSTYNAAAGVWSASGATADVNSLLAGVTFNPALNFNGDFTVATSVSDGVAPAVTGTKAFTGTSVNDAPVNTVPSAQTLAEDGTLVFNTANGNAFSISDVDAGTDPITVTLSATNGVLSLSGVADLTFMAGDGTADTTMTFTGTQADINAALEGLSFAPGANFNGTAGVTILTNDNGATGTGGNLSDTDNVDIAVSAVNDAPSIGFVTTPVTETSLGDFNSRAISDFIGVTDFVLGDSITLSTLTVWIRDGLSNDNGQLDNFNGTLSWAIYADNGGTPGTLLYSGADADPLLIDTGTQYRAGSPFDADLFTATVDLPAVPLPAGTYWLSLHEGALGSSFDGTSISWVEATDNPGAATYFITADETEINGPFVTSGNASTTFALSSAPSAVATEGGALDLRGTILVADPDSGPGDLTMTLSVGAGVINVSAGSSGVDVAGSGTAAVTLTGTLAEIRALLAAASDGTAEYLTTGDAPPASDSLTVTVNDGGNTGSGGALQATGALPITIIPVNDAPAGTDKTLTLNEDGSVAITSADLGFSDVDGNALQSVTITTLPTAGTLTLAGAAVAAGAVVTAAQLTAGELVFTPAPDANGTGYANLTFQVTDDGGTANGGQNTDQSPNTLTFDVTPVDDDPVAIDDAFVIREGEAGSGNVYFDNFFGPDIDVDSPLPPVVAVNGNTAAIGETVTLSSGASVTMNADGTFIYNQNGIFDSNPAAQSGAINVVDSDSFTYTLAGGSTATVSLTVTGIDSADILLGSSNADRLFGGNFDDVLIGGLGGDLLDGGSGSDTASYADSQSAVSVNLLLGQGVGGTAQGDTYQSIENLIGSIFNDTLIGDAGSNVLEGRAGNDLLMGGAGVDFIFGGSGNDTTSYASSSSAVQVDLNAQNSWDGASMDFLNSIENATGSAFSDVLLGNGLDNILEGGGGVDFLFGGGGSDTASYAGSSFGVQVDLSAQHSWDGASMDFLNSIENATGSAFNDILVGDEFDNVLDGGPGGRDQLNGGAGFDTVSCGSATGGVYVDLGAQHSWDGQTMDFFSSIEGATGSAFGDTLLAAAAGSTLAGGAGDDLLYGGAGSDRFAFLLVNGETDLGSDRIIGFTPGTDKLVIDRDLGSFTDASQFGSFAQQVGNDVLITLNAQSTVTLVDVQLSALSQGDFEFTGGATTTQAETATLTYLEELSASDGGGAWTAMTGTGQADLEAGGYFNTAGSTDLSAVMMVI